MIYVQGTLVRIGIDPFIETPVYFEFPLWQSLKNAASATKFSVQTSNALIGKLPADEYKHSILEALNMKFTQKTFQFFSLAFED